MKFDAKPMKYENFTCQPNRTKNGHILSRCNSCNKFFNFSKLTNADIFKCPHCETKIFHD